MATKPLIWEWRNDEFGLLTARLTKNGPMVIQYVEQYRHYGSKLWEHVYRMEPDIGHWPTNTKHPMPEELRGDEEAIKKYLEALWRLSK